MPFLLFCIIVGTRGEGMKKCSMCQTEKELDQFGKDRSRSDGLETKCKECKRLKRKKEYAENREEILSKS